MATLGLPAIMHLFPLPGTPGAPPTFNGRNVTSFLKKYDFMCDKYQIQDSMRLKMVSEYCEDNMVWEIEGFAAWEEKNWDRLKAEMMHEWRREDTEQLMYTRIFLEEYVSKPRGKDGLKHYYRQYDRIAKVLVARNELDSYSQGRLFILRLPEGVRYKVLSKQEVFSRAPAGSVNYPEVLQAVKAIVETEEMMEHFVTQPERQTSISNLADFLNKVEPSTKEAEMRFSGAEAQEKSQPKEDALKLLTRSLETLILPITTAVARMEAAAVTMSTPNSANRQTVGLDPALNRRQMPVLRQPYTTTLQTVKRQPEIRDPLTAYVGRVETDYGQEAGVEVVEVVEVDEVDAFGVRAGVQEGNRPSNRPIETDPVKDSHSLRTGVWEPEQGTQSGITAGLSREETLEMDDDVPGVPEPPGEETAEIGDAPGVPQPPTQKGNTMPKITLKKLLAGHADPLSVIDKILQRSSTISWANAIGLSWERQGEG
jgi:hypothetical protein